MKSKGRYYSLWSRQGFFLSEELRPKSPEPARQEEHHTDLINVSEIKEAPSNPGPISAKDNSANGTKANKVWKPEAPEFVPCNISRWKPTPVIPDSSFQYPTGARSQHTTKNQVVEPEGDASKISTTASNLKENTRKAIVPDRPEPKAQTAFERDNRSMVPGASGITKEPLGKQPIPLPTNSSSPAGRKELPGTPRRKRKRVSRFNTPKSISAGVNGGEDSVNGSSTSTYPHDSVHDQPSAETSAPLLSPNVDNSANPRRRRRNRHPKSRSPRKPLNSVTNGGSDTPPAAQIAQFTNGFQTPCREATSVLRFPPAA